MNPAIHRHLRDCFLAGVAYVAMVWLCTWLLRHPLQDAATWIRVLVVLMPILPMAYAIRACVRIILAGDELQRRIDLEAIAIAALAVSIGTLTLSLLMVVKVVDISGKDALVWVFPALWVSYGFARVWAGLRYR